MQRTTLCWENSSACTASITCTLMDSYIKLQRNYAKDLKRIVSVAEKQQALIKPQPQQPNALNFNVSHDPSVSSATIVQETLLTFIRQCSQHFTNVANDLAMSVLSPIREGVDQLVCKSNRFNIQMRNELKQLQLRSENFKKTRELFTSSFSTTCDFQASVNSPLPIPCSDDFAFGEKGITRARANSHHHLLQVLNEKIKDTNLARKKCSLAFEEWTKMTDRVAQDIKTTQKNLQGFDDLQINCFGAFVGFSSSLVANIQDDLKAFAKTLRERLDEQPPLNSPSKYFNSIIKNMDPPPGQRNLTFCDFQQKKLPVDRSRGSLKRQNALHYSDFLALSG